MAKDEIMNVQISKPKLYIEDHGCLTFDFIEIEHDLEERMLKNEKCKNCAFFHLNNGLVDPKIKCYCFFAYDCLIGHKHRFVSKESSNGRNT